MESIDVLPALKKELRILKVDQQWTKGKIVEFRAAVESNKEKLKSLNEEIAKLTPAD
jgi:hypothetical protein